MTRLWWCFAASALMAIGAGLTAAQPNWLLMLFKPLTTVLVIVHAASRGEAGQPQRRALLVGLGCSLVGDVALLWPQQGFLPGLVSFLLAHVAYLVAFSRGVRLAARPLAFAAYGLLAGSLLMVLWPGVPQPLRLPVLVYVVALSAMAAQTASWAAVRRRDGLAAPAQAWCAALGGLLFVASDATLAFNRFHSPVPASTLWILASYWAAQWLIASSLAPRQGLKA